MAKARLLMTGFGPFGDVSRNPSGWIAEQLAQVSPEDLQVTSQVLPVTFEDAPVVLERFVNAHESPAPRALLSLGVHPRPGFCLESRARPRPTSKSVDNAGQVGFQGNPTSIQLKDRSPSFDVGALHKALSLDDVSISTDAGGYVCDWVFQHLLAHGQRLAIPALFLHVPPFDQATEEHLLEVTSRVAHALANL